MEIAILGLSHFLSCAILINNHILDCVWGVAMDRAVKTLIHVEALLLVLINRIGLTQRIFLMLG